MSCTFWGANIKKDPSEHEWVLGGDIRTMGKVIKKIIKHDELAKNILIYLLFIGEVMHL